MKPWHAGWPLLVLMCGLPALAYATQSYWPIIALLCIPALTIPRGTYKPRRRAAKPRGERGV